MSGEDPKFSVACTCGKKLRASVSAVGKKAKCPGCGAMLELTFVAVPVVAPVPSALPMVKPVEVELKKPPAEMSPVPSELGPQTQPVLAYQTPPSLSSGAPKSRWKISGQTTKRVTCTKCACTFRYGLTRTTRSWSTAYLAVIVGMILASVLSCLFPAVLIAFGGFLILGIRIWLRIVVRVFASGVASMREGGDYASANRRLRRELDRAAEPVPCPQCGWYQRNMVREARARSFEWARWLQLAVLILAPIFWFVAWHWQLFRRVRLLGLNWTDAWVVAGLVAVLAAALVGVIAGLRWGLSFSVDPNAGYPAEREPYPNSPMATTEAEWTKQMAAQTSRVTAARQPRAAVGGGPRRIVPPGTR